MKQKGYTLIELLVFVVLAVIVPSIGYFLYLLVRVLQKFAA